MGTKISDLPVASAVAGANLLPIVQSGVTNKATVTQLFTSPALVTPALGTPSSGVATNLTGTAAGLTAGNVTTNANLTGPVTSIGNATTIVGPIDAVIIGASTAAAGSFTQANVSSKILVNGPATSIYAYGSQLYGTAANGSSNAFQWQYSANTTAATYLFVKTRGTTSATFDLVVNGDDLGTLAFCGTNGAAVCTTGLVYAKIAGVASLTSMPTSLGFSTTPTGSIAASTRMLIDPDGTLNVYANVKVNQLSAIPAGGSQTQALNFSSTANFGIFYGSGAPTLSAAQGSLYLRSDGSSTSTRMYVNTNGSTTWTAVTTAA
jgi:hypothetical protein